MTRDDIIRLAEEAGVHEGGAANWINGNRWEGFAELVAAAEREEILKIIRDMFGGYSTITEAIRARGRNDKS